MSEPIQCLEAMIWPREDGTFDCPWLTPYCGDLTEEEYDKAGTALSIRHGCFRCYAKFEWELQLKVNDWREEYPVAYAAHPDWPGEWVCVIPIQGLYGIRVGYEIQYQLYETLHEAETAGWALIYSGFNGGKTIYAAENRKTNERSTSMIQNISIDRLHPHPKNPRRDLGDLTELAESIKARGVMQNLTVVWDNAISEKLGGDHYTVVIGHRRCSAAKLAGLTELPCSIVEMDERTQVATMLLENIQRADLSVMEQAEGFQMMLDLGESVKGIAEKTGFAETTVRHRVKLNELDKQKLTEATMRGGRLEDYIALEKIKDAKVRDRLLGDIGTNNFDWNLKKAIKEQEKPERKKALICEPKKFAKPIKENQTNGLSYVTSWYDFEGKVEKRADAKTAEYFYTVDNYRATLYKKAEEAQVKKKTEKEKRFEKREKEFKALTKRAYELRSAFVKNFSAFKKYAPEINAFAFRRLLRYGGAELDIVLKLLDIEKPEGDRYNSEAQRIKRGLIFDKYMEQPERVMLIVAYATYEDKPGNGYFYAQSYNGFKIEHKQNGDLDAIYDGLIALGYEMSEEEQQLRDGTHELFDRLEPGDVKADADDEEESDGQEEDDAE